MRAFGVDLAVVGSGFGGALLASIARRIGLKVALVEKGTHPRFAIGESSSPLANLLLEELSDRYELDRIRPLAAYGTWLAEHPELDCGLKRGFTFYAERPGRLFEARPGRENELLVGASPNDHVADTHWMRSDVDRFFVEEAQRLGAEYLDRTVLSSMDRGAECWRLEGARAGRPIAVSARVVVDATGPAGFLSRSLGIPASGFADLPETSGLYAHFAGARRLDEPDVSDGVRPPYRPDDVTVPPYRPDDAAVHHVFDGGWVWVLRFRSGIVSAGVAASPRLAAKLELGEGEAAWRRLLRRFPTLAARFGGARAIVPFVHAPRLPYRAARAAGRGWAMLPSAAAFVDPLLSTGFPLTLLGVERIARTLESGPDSPGLDAALARHGEATLAEADAAATLVSALWASFADFELFSALTLLYFAAASYAEAARRLGRGHLAGSFLSADRPDFGPAAAECCAGVISAAKRGTLSRERERWIANVYEAIEPLDVAGLSDRSRLNWHPVEAEPLLAAASKLHATTGEIQEMLDRTGFTASVSRETPA